MDYIKRCLLCERHYIWNVLFFAIDYIGENPRIVAEYQILC